MTNLLLDTDILINWLRGNRWERDLLLRSGARFYYSVVSRKELLAKRGLTDRERRKILVLLSWLRKVAIDPAIAHRAFILHKKYARRLAPADAIIAATAWSKNLVLVTRNTKHFSFIAEIQVNQL